MAEMRLEVGGVLTSTDPEPGHWVTVRDRFGDDWRRTDSNCNGGGGANAARKLIDAGIGTLS